MAARGLQSTWGDSCDAQAQSLHGMWGLPESGVEPASPALAGGFFTMEPPGKPLTVF